jgi:hypothetical protein
MLYYSFLQPYFNYCILIWGNAADIHLNKLILLQKRAIRIISRVQYLEHTTNLFSQLKILKLKDLYQQRCALFTYKLYSNQFPAPFTNDFAMTVLSHSHNTRARTLRYINIPTYRTTLKQKTLKYQSSKLYNDFLLPNNFHSFNSTNSLKNALFKQFHLNYVYSPN